MMNLETVTLTAEQETEVAELLKAFETAKQEITSPYQITKEIKPRQKAAFFADCRKAEKAEIFSLCKAFFRSVAPSLSSDARKALKKGEMLKKVVLNLYACGLSAYEIGQAENLFDYFASYTAFKAENFVRLADYGAIADLVETAVHCIACREMWRVHLKSLHVSVVGAIDVTINRIKWEVGTNGKSFMESTPLDFMAGKYNGMIYGVFSDEEKDTLCKLFISGKTFEGLTYIAKRLYVWEDKNAFVPFCESLCKKSALEWNKNGNYARFRYSESTDKAFRKEVKKQEIPSLYQYMKTLSDNDFLLNE